MEKTIVNMVATEIIHRKGIQFPASRSPRDFNLVLIAMEEYASLQSASLEEENRKMTEEIRVMLEGQITQKIAYENAYEEGYAAGRNGLHNSDLQEENKKLREALYTAHHLILSGKGICDYDKDLSMKWATTDVESLLSQPKEETL